MNRIEFLKNTKLIEYYGTDKNGKDKNELHYINLLSNGRELKCRIKHWNKNELRVDIICLDENAHDLVVEHICFYKFTNTSNLFDFLEKINKEMKKFSFCKGCNDIKSHKHNVCNPCMNKMFNDEKTKITDFIQRDEKCVICQEELKSSDNLFIMNNCCNNILHYNCLKNYVKNLTNKYSCVICRSEKNPFPKHYEYHDHNKFYDNDDE